MKRTLLLTGTQTLEVGASEANPGGEDLGRKAEGLLWLPPAWVPPFLIVSGFFFEAFRTASEFDARRLVGDLARRIRSSVSLVGIGATDALKIRSNTAGELEEHRGSFISTHSSQEDLEPTLLDYLFKTRELAPPERMPLIIQRYIEPLARGLLSNQRTAVREYRDALAEIEFPIPGPIKEHHISYRRWRHPRPASEDSLLCTSQDDLLNMLREPLSFAANRQKRVLFEWVWDGRVLHVVQADLAAERTEGVSPTAVLRPRAAADPSDLSRFHVLEEKDDLALAKVRNHSLYRQSGFWQPQFYVLSDDSALEEIVSGRIGSELRGDLRVLTQAPLVIRTAVGQEGAPLLPRSPILMSEESAENWACKVFAPAIVEAMGKGTKIVLVAHHYVPALAAAFAIAEPGRQDVYLEAGWGIPEGLYYFPCDRYTVNTLKRRAEELTPGDYERFVVEKDVQRKSFLVAPDSRGDFVRYAVAAPWDWKQVIQDLDVFGSIATFTRSIAERERKLVNLMWFVGCRTAQGTQKAIPWYHELYDQRQPTAQYQRNTRDTVVTIAGEADLRALEQRTAGGLSRGSRLVVHLSPSEAVALRDLDFATRVGDATKRLDGIVVLEGAQLSHVYYALRRSGATVSVRAASPTPRLGRGHGKLVRDGIPDKVLASGEGARVANLAPATLLAALKMKLVEEAFEVRDARPGELLEELADVLEVVWATVRVAGSSRAELERMRKKKAGARGGFEGGRFLVATGAPLAETPPTLALGEPDYSPGVRTIAHVPPLESAKAGPADRRAGLDWVEFVQTATIALTHPEWRLQSPGGSLLLTGISSEAIEWVLEGRREGGRLVLRLKIRVGPEQLELPFEFPDEEGPP